MRRRDKDDDGSSIDRDIDDVKKSSTPEIMEDISHCNDDSEGTTTLFEAKINATSANVPRIVATRAGKRFEYSNLRSFTAHSKLNFSLRSFAATPTSMFAHVHLCNLNVWLKLWVCPRKVEAVLLAVSA